MTTKMSHLRTGHRNLSSLSLAGLLLVGACASAARPPAPVGGAPTAAEGTRVLPPVPQVLGTLAIDVVYPPEGANIAVRDNTFIFGNVGRGDATLTINGQPVEVAANG